MPEEISTEQYIQLFLGMLYDQERETNALWLELDEELRLHNRFMPQSRFCEKLTSLSEVSKTVLKKDCIMYRSRLIAKEKEFSFQAKLLDEQFGIIHEICPELNLTGDRSEIIKFVINLNNKPEMATQLYEKFGDMFKKYSVKDNMFWGYDATASDAPPSGITSAGRINPCGISYLYAAGDLKTSVLEVRPVITQYVSIAEIEITEDCVMFDFSKKNIPNNEKVLLQGIDYGVISQYFSQPNYGGESYYHVTQYVSEYIKNIKDSSGNCIFDGICFNSSLNPEGINYVLFDTSKKRKYHVMNSGLYQVKDLLGNTNCVLPADIRMWT